MTNHQPTPTKNSDKPADSYSEETQHARSVAPPAPVEAPVAPDHKCKPENNQSRWNRARSYLNEHAVSIASMFFAGLAALYSYKQAIVAERALIEVQRAFITVSELKMERIAGGDGKVKWLRLTPVIKNTGNTPAVGVSLVLINPLTDWAVAPNSIRPEEYGHLSWKVGAPRDPDEMIDNPAGGIYARKNFAMGPQGSLTISGLSTDLPATSGLAAMNTAIGRFIYGSIRYDDAFTKPHISKFCFRTDGIKFIADDIELRQDLCSHWNCTDDYCKPDKEAYEADWKKAVAERAKR